MYTDPIFNRPFIRGMNTELCNKCQCAEQHIDGFYNLFFDTAFMMTKLNDVSNEKETEKMGKITISDCTCKKFDDFKVGECFMRIGNVYMKLKPGNDVDNAVNLETGGIVTLAAHVECAPVHEFHWTDKK